ncbi:MAG TPA: DUF1847 domain-containing protein [Candidatus Butyricicoccus stercorigallinarum]|nr:DUF1847 domain-containing protein [Candidatus Butyricicoccus stercorigallinarum]
MNESALSCANCAVINCDTQDKSYPPFCLTTHLDPALRAQAIACYAEDDNRRIMQTAARVEYDGYLKWTRVQETMTFARRMGYQKIGIATCVGLIRETRTLAQLLREQGFSVYGAACKVGAVPKTELGIDPDCAQIGCNSCNPILQAKLLNREKTDLNIIMGLCVGHDILFTKYSDAPVTTLVTKDRVLGHNPAAALYTADSYYAKLRNPIEE